MFEQFVFLCFYKDKNASREDPAEDRCWSQNSGHGVHKENICRVWPTRLHKSEWDCYIHSSGALIQNACTSILWRILWSCMLTSCSFSETKTVIMFKSKRQVVWWFIRTNISWLKSENPRVIGPSLKLQQTYYLLLCGNNWILKNADNRW